MPDNQSSERNIWIDHDGLDRKLWRYMDFPKFADLLQRRSLWFTRLDQFPDPYEGSLTKPTAAFFAEVRSRTGFRGGIQHEKWRKIRCVNCWHMSDYESAAMWDLYSKQSGVAICSSIARLEPSFPSQVTGGSWGIAGQGVRYVDFDKDNVATWNEEGHVEMTLDVFCKRKSFEHEREYRLVTNLEANETEFPGKHIPVRLEVLVEKIVVCPTPLAPKWLADVVRKEVHIHGLNVEVVQSDLYSPLMK